MGDSGVLTITLSASPAGPTPPPAPSASVCIRIMGGVILYAEPGGAAGASADVALEVAAWIGGGDPVGDTGSGSCRRMKDESRKIHER